MIFESKSNVYIFRIDKIERKYIYYRTFSIWTKRAQGGRDIRKPSTVEPAKFEHMMSLLNQPVVWIQEYDDINNVIKRNCDTWLLLPAHYAEKHLQCLLKTHECVVSPIGLFWDIKLPRGRAANRRIPQKVRCEVLKRDGNKCIECGKNDHYGIELTMDHVIPFSRGGESTSGNLVTLCKSCNQRHGNNHHPHLFVLAGLHHGWDRRLLDNTIFNDNTTLAIATYFSSNIMVCRCKTSNFPCVDITKNMHCHNAL